MYLSCRLLASRRLWLAWFLELWDWALSLADDEDEGFEELATDCSCPAIPAPVPQRASSMEAGKAQKIFDSLGIDALVKSASASVAHETQNLLTILG
jgi:hypothetical protein